MTKVKYSPWGAIQHAKQVAEGIELVSTAGHGGFKLDRRRNAKMPEVFRRPGGWYEEDCEYALVVLIFPELFSEKEVEAAHKSAKNWFPDEYEKHFGVVIPLNESGKKRERAFKAETQDKFVVRAAWGDYHKNVPAGMVGVLAKCESTQEEKSFLVPGTEYAQRSPCGFVIDPAIHQEISSLLSIS